MLSTAIIAVLIIALLGCAAKRHAAPAMKGGPVEGAVATLSNTELTVGIYNIHRARGVDAKKDLSRIAVRLSEVDLIGLCECEGPAIWGGADQCAALGNQLGMNAIFSPTQRRWGRYDRGNGFLSRFPISDWYQEPLVDSTGTHPRCLLRADVVIDGETVPVFVTHLARRIDQAIQLEIVMQRFSQFDRAILLGDFNLSHDAPELAAFIAADRQLDALGVAGVSTAARIDWIFTRGFDVLEGGSEPLGPSDHPYYWVKLAL